MGYLMNRILSHSKSNPQVLQILITYLKIRHSSVVSIFHLYPDLSNDDLLTVISQLPPYFIISNYFFVSSTNFHGMLKSQQIILSYFHGYSSKFSFEDTLFSIRTVLLEISRLSETKNMESAEFCFDLLKVLIESCQFEGEFKILAVQTVFKHPIIMDYFLHSSTVLSSSMYLFRFITNY